MFGLSMLATLVFLVGYFAIPDDATFFFPGLGEAKTLNIVARPARWASRSSSSASAPSTGPRP